jgi:D-arabinose 1-dehydrogenase-like Zn-dependent alcohol dehydrogenase
VSGSRDVKPMPHIPGVETSGIIEKTGKNVTSIREGDMVIIYNRLFDGTCDICTSGNEMLCRNGGFIGVIALLHDSANRFLLTF